MIAAATNTSEILHRRGTTSDIMEAVYDCYLDSWAQVEDFAGEVVGSSTLAKCRYIFDFVENNIKYQLDPFKKQWIRTPARLWADKEGDCKSFAIFICSCLRCMGIPHCFRFASYGSDKEPTHVYAVAFDELGNEIIVDPVYRDSDGKAIFNEECKYENKIDMAGTTEISRLSGTGVGFLSSTEMIAIQGKEYLPRGEQDFLINLNILNQSYIGAVKSGNLPWANHLANLMDVASVAILCYEVAGNGGVDIERAIACLRDQYSAGVFDSAIGITIEDREQVCEEVLGYIVKNYGDAVPSDDDLAFLLFETSQTTPGFNPEEFLGNAGVGFLSTTVGIGASSKVTQEQINGAVQTLTDGCEYFMYTFIPDSKIGEYPDPVREKRAYYKSIYEDLERGGVMTKELALKTLNAAISAKYDGLSGLGFLLAVKDGTIPSIIAGPLSWTAIISIVLGVLSALAPLFESLFGTSKEETNAQLELNSPDLGKDGFLTGTTTGTTTGITTGDSLITTPTNTVASSNWLGIGAALLVLGSLFFGGKKK